MEATPSLDFHPICINEKRWRSSFLTLLPMNEILVNARTSNLVENWHKNDGGKQRSNHSHKKVHPDVKSAKKHFSRNAKHQNPGQERGQQTAKKQTLLTFSFSYLISSHLNAIGIRGIRFPPTKYSSFAFKFAPRSVRRSQALLKLQFDF